MSTPNATPSLQQKPDSHEPGLLPEGVKMALIFILLLAVGYLLYDSIQYKRANKVEFARIDKQLQVLDKSSRLTESRISNQLTDLEGAVQGTQQDVGNTKVEIKKTAAQLQAEAQKARAELSKKADASQVEAQVQAVKAEANTKIGQVNTEVGGVKTQVEKVKTDLESTRRDLEGTQRQLLDVRDTLSAAVAKNSSELAQLRAKGDRDYIEFTIPKKNEAVKVEDIRLVLTKTDAKNGKFTIRIAVDDNRLEKKDRYINEPIQFLVGQNRVRYEVVVNWVQKDRVGGYLSVPKDKALAGERTK